MLVYPRRGGYRVLRFLPGSTVASQEIRRVIGVAKRKFTLHDQLDFAAASLDYNPIHIDETRSRRLLFGAPVVHGIHGVLWALDFLAWKLGRSFRLDRLNAEFSKPVLIGEEVALKWERETEEFLVATLTTRSQGKATRLRVSLAGPYPDDGVRLTELLAPPECQERDEAYLDSAAGAFPVARSAALKNLFPNLCAHMSEAQAATLLATSRTVGMECPGLHSLFSRLTLEFHPPTEATEPSFSYKTLRWRPRYRKLDLSVQTFNATGVVECFVRPAPVQQASLETILAMVAPEEFSGQKALVVGGSRGLGEVTAKLLSAGGAEVALTFHRLRRDADRVERECRERGKGVQIRPFDVRDPNAASDLTFRAFTHLYYFATPRILQADPMTFQPDLLAAYREYYVEGLSGLLRRLARRSGPKLAVFYPSSTYCTACPPGYAEYAQAKREGEELCRQVSATDQNAIFFVPRLPPLRTDQTASILPSDLADPAPYLFAKLRHFALLVNSEFDST